MKKNAYAIIMAGGKGERFWPLSTSKHPKQVLKIFTGKPLIATSVDRIKGLIPKENILIITSKDLVKVCRKAVPGLPVENIIGEPVGKDTAAACALGTAIAKRRNPDAVCCVLTADHIIKDLEKFRRILTECINIAEQGKDLVTLGIKPYFPSTGFGYISASTVMPDVNGVTFFKAGKFVEKPAIEKAKEYIATGMHFWNSGMFIWKADLFIAALQKHAHQLYGMTKRLIGAKKGFKLEKFLETEYKKLDRISVDYAVMEKSDNIVMAGEEFGWDDVGSWVALKNHFPSDVAHNVCIGDSLVLDSTDNIVVSESGHLTACVGVKDVIVVRSKNATLVCHKDSAQKIKELLRLILHNDRYRKHL